MIALFLPTEDDSTRLLVGFTTEDLASMVQGAVAGPFDLTGIFALGKPLPSSIVMVYARDEEEVMDRMRSVIPNLDERIFKMDEETQ